MAVAGPALLPTRVPTAAGEPVRRPGIRGAVNLRDRLFVLELPERSLLDGRTLAESLIGSALGVHVLALERAGEVHRAPGPERVLKGGDRVLVEGRADYFLELSARRHVAQHVAPVTPAWLESEEIGLARARVAPGSEWIGRTAAQLDLAAARGVMLLSLARATTDRVFRTRVVDLQLEEGDELLLHGRREALEALGMGHELHGLEAVPASDAIREFDLEECLWALRVTDDSLLEGRALGDTRLGDAAGLLVLAILRDDGGKGAVRTRHLPGPGVRLHRGDQLLVKTRPEDLAVLRGLQRLRIDRAQSGVEGLLDGGDAGFVEVVLSPRSALVGKSLRESNFRARFGLHVVGVVREGKAVSSDLRDEPLRFGDALLLYGPRGHQRALVREPDVIPLHSPEMEPPRLRLAPLSIIVAALGLVPVALGWIPVAVGILGGALAMVLTRCLAPDEAYRAIDWPMLVLVAGMLALGRALELTGAVDLAEAAILGLVGDLGPHAVLVSLVLTAAALGQIVPGPAAVALLAPVASSAGSVLGVSPYPFVMAVAIAGTSVASPVSAPGHALVMAPAGYRMHDYLRLGVPVTLVVLLLTVLVTPLFLPFS